MNRSLTPWGWSVFGLLVAIGLGFGVAHAGSGSVDGCLDEPPDFLGECVGGDLGDRICQQDCEFHGGWLGLCFQDNPAPAPRCCICAL